MARRIREHDWKQTSLGPIGDWPEPLQTAVGIMLHAGLPVALCWGHELVFLCNDAWSDLVGNRAADGLGLMARDIPAGNRGMIVSGAQDVLAGSTAVPVRNHPLSGTREGRTEEAWFDVSFGAIPIEDGTAGGVFIIASETTGRVLAERRWQDGERRLTAELQHRVRNLLSVVRSVFSRTAETGRDPQGVVDHFAGRLDALARTQVSATGDLAGLVDLENIIRDELLNIAAGAEEGIVIDGPTISLNLKEAESLGLAVHELFMNAIKFGALRTTGATLEVVWSIDARPGGENWLDLVWVERGVPAVPVQAVRQGFGRELIEHALPYRLGGETKLDMLGGGIRCAISIPLALPQGPAAHEGVSDV